MVGNNGPKSRRARMRADEVWELTVTEPEPSDEDIAKALAEEQPAGVTPQEVGHSARQYVASLSDESEDPNSCRRTPMKSFEIMFDDLNDDAQKRFLEFQGLENPEDGNYETMRIAIVDLEHSDGEGEGQWQ